MKTKKLGILLCVCIVLCGVLYWYTRPNSVIGEKEIDVVVIHGDKQQNTFTYQTEAEYLGEVLEENELVYGTEGPYGLFITTVDGETADESKQQWWCITKSGEMLETSADNTPIADGEQYELTLTTGY